MAKRLATEVRAFAADAGFTVGARGRLSAEVFEAYLVTLPTSEVRALATDAGIEVGQKGRIAPFVISNLAETLR